ncbi:MAG: hypothetical protein ACTSPB_08920, partial [Candidatus Thorarchaeota archaeon]
MEYREQINKLLGDYNYSNFTEIDRVHQNLVGDVMSGLVPSNTARPILEKIIDYKKRYFQAIDANPGLYSAHLEGELKNGVNTPEEKEVLKEFKVNMITDKDESGVWNRWKRGLVTAAAVTTAGLLAFSVGSYLGKKNSNNPAPGWDEPYRRNFLSDLDGDGLLNHIETKLGTDATNLDTDGDGLSDVEDLYFAKDPLKKDTDGNGVSDLKEVSEELLRQYESAMKEGWVTEHPTFGLERCNVCGKTVNMGYVEIKNPNSGFSMRIPYIAFHTMKHDNPSLEFWGDEHKGRLNPIQLERVLNYGLPKIAMIDPNDLDGDRLTNEMEKKLGTAPDWRDSDGDSLKDMDELIMGFDPRTSEGSYSILTKNILEAYKELPSNQKEDFMMRGVVACPICGETVNMGYVVVRNDDPEKYGEVSPGLSQKISYLALHMIEKHPGEDVFFENLKEQAIADPKLPFWVLDVKKRIDPE